MSKKLPLYLFIISIYLITIILFFNALTLGSTSGIPDSFFRYLIMIFVGLYILRYFVALTINPWYQVVAEKNKYIHGPKKDYFVSVLVPAWNEEVGVVHTLESVLNGTYKNFEVIVVNDGSTDDTEEKVTTFIDKLPSELRSKVVYQYISNGGKARALNKALSLAKGDVVMTIDSDCYVPPKTIQAFVDYFQDERVMMVGGNVRIGNIGSIIGAIQEVEYLLTFYLKRSSSIVGGIFCVGGAAAAFRREVFDKVGYFDENSITEDIDITMRVQDAGLKVVYASDAIIYTEGASTILGLVRQRLRWRWGRIEAFLRHRHLFFSRKQHHKKVLTYFTLPFALITDLQLLLEPFFFTFLIYYALTTDNYFLIVNSILVVAFIFLIKVVFSKQGTEKARLFFIAPVVWLIYYIVTLVEFIAFVQVFARLMIRKKVTWQKWKRSGLLGELQV